MEMSGLITLTTDFGTRDPYAGIMKGTILTANPQARIIDITHEILKHDITNASFTLGQAYEHFPQGTVHVGVVDPEVGEARKNIAILTEHYIFVGPDNGIFTMVLSREKALDIREIKNPPFVLDKISNTFHGRDVFSPCSAYLSAGRNFSEVGPEMKNMRHLKYPKVSQGGNNLKGEVVAIDSFGNMITNISEHTLRSFMGKKKVEIYFATERFTSIMHYYNDVPPKTVLVLIGSSGYLEISMNGESAEDYFMTSVGSPVTIRKY
ncbi:MAG: SAM-dependent chlorinase/fluorinase [Candidatus Latescibacter sp.]|nr:SAM-dependent chlorinase/fluorinase [Candidatus Latescibacter sp.]